MSDFINRYPYSDAHELNLDWIIAEVKRLKGDMAGFKAANEIKYADPIQWDITTQYEINTIVSDLNTGRSYLSMQPVPAGVNILNTDYWLKIGNFVVDPFLNVTSYNPVANKPVAVKFNEVNGIMGDIRSDLNVEIINRKNDVHQINEDMDALNAALASETSERITQDNVLSSRIDEIIALPDGSTTADAELIDIRTAADGQVYASAGDAVRGQVDNLQDEIDNIISASGNLFDKSTVITGYVLAQSGSTVITAPTNQYSYSDEIPVEYNKTYSFLSDSGLGASEGKVYIYDASHTYLGVVNGTISNDIVTFTNTYSSGVYARINVLLANLTSEMFVSGGTYPNEYTPYGLALLNSNLYIDNDIKIKDFKKGVDDVISMAVNILDLTDADIVQNKILAMSGSTVIEIAVNGYAYSGYIPVELGSVYTFKDLTDLGSAHSKVFLYDEDKEFIESVDCPADAIDTTIDHLTVAKDSVKYVRINFPIGKDYMLIEGVNYPPVYHAYNEFGVIISQASVTDVLSGKKLVTAGDSYTAAAFTGAYSAYNGKNYGYYIAQRNNMTFVNDAVSGSTMTVTDPDNPSLRSPFSYQRYLNIPADTDYLTIWFGINDSAYADLGTIDDADNTTFYGAWNKVLKYFLTNYPYMKIGIIITDASDDLAFQEAVRQVAIKWGYPYLDLRKNPYLPAFFDKEGMCSEAQALRRNAFGWNGPVAGHPNPERHLYESTIIEAFLRSI